MIKIHKLINPMRFYTCKHSKLIQSKQKHKFHGYDVFLCKKCIEQSRREKIKYKGEKRK
jgi:hypothetical protein